MHSQSSRPACGGSVHSSTWVAVGALTLGASVFAMSASVGCSAKRSEEGPAELVVDAALGPSDGGDNFDVSGGLDVTPTDGPLLVGEPRTCEEAAAAKSYVGCDYWPTVVANIVWSVFDYAVVVANAGDETATVTVTGPGGVNKTATVAAGSLTKIYLPWVADLKGPDGDHCTIPKPITASVKSVKGAYHLVSTKPVTVYQFNALEYKGAGGPAGKSWSSCPGTTSCASLGGPVGCFSFSNDASLLLPSTAMTGTYRVTGVRGWSSVDVSGGPDFGVLGAYVAITATQDDTTVTFKVSSKGKVLAGGGIVATPAGGTLTLSLNAGDVAELMGEADKNSDLSGSLVKATKPVQVITGIPCTQMPLTNPPTQACDHLEESSFPAETLGKDYFVTVPTGPQANLVGHVVRIYGNVDGTTLTYAGTKPAGAPTTINAGDVIDLGMVSADFRVTGSASFAVGTIMLSAKLADPGTALKGDPSQSLSTAVEQYRKRYIFLAPDDYDVSFIDVVAPDGTTLSLDGTAPTVSPKPIGTTGFGVYRIKLGAGKQGAHELRASNPVGLQVMGYGSYTSYQYPGGLDLKSIAPPPVK